MSEHEYFMRVALEEARQALAAGEFPVGCVMVADGLIVGKGRRHNSLEANRNEIDHAEVVTLRGVIAEQIHLALPLKPLCREDCPGICPRCGRPGAEADCGCAPVAGDPRWEALKKLTVP